MIQSTQGRTSCGSLLIDFLEVACGTNGIRSGWSSRMAMKYPNLQGKLCINTVITCLMCKGAESGSEIAIFVLKFGQCKCHKPNFPYILATN